MILDFYKLREQPFGATPDTAFLFSSETHREALASLLYGIQEGRGFIGLIASPGMGKTTLLFRTLSQMKDRAKTVFLFHSMATPADFLRTLLNDLGIEGASGSLAELQAQLTEVLLEQARRGERLVIVIDEAQNLDNSVLELVRMLSNFETSKDKLMHIILSGQPQLAVKLASPDLLQLRQRISIIARLEPFTMEETTLYVNHRLQAAGYSSSTPLFSPGALKLIAEHSGGIPRNINTLCFNAMSIGCALKKPTINSDVLREVVTDLDLDALSTVMGAHASLGTRRGKRPLGLGWVPRIALLAGALLALSVIPETEDGVIAKATALYPKVAPKVMTGAAPQKVPAAASSDGTSLPPIPEAAALPSGPSPVSAAQVKINDTSRAADSNGTRPAVRNDDTEGSLTDRLEPGLDSIVVAPGMTLAQICAEAFASCHTKEFDAIRQLNPWILNADRIDAGRVVLIPHRSESTDAKQLTGHPTPVNPKRS